MIETLMALWNRGVSGRLMVMTVTFFCLCISISLLFVTVGSVWGSLLAHGRPGSPEAHVSNPVVITATAPSSTATAQVGVTPVLPSNPCLASPTGARADTPQVNTTRNQERSGVSTTTATAGPLHGTPTPGATITPQPSPTASPTFPAVTPSVSLTPTATTQPTVTPTVITTPTVTASPTDTSTPGMTPTVPGSTPTVGIVPTATDTPTVTATGTAPAGSPTVMVSATGGTNSRQVHDGRPQEAGTPAGANNGQTGAGNCLGDTLLTGGQSALIARLQNFLWIILVSSLLGTTLFCAQVYRLSRKFHQRGF